MTTIGVGAGRVGVIAIGRRIVAGEGSREDPFIRAPVDRSGLGVVRRRGLTRLVIPRWRAGERNGCARVKEIVSVRNTSSQ